MKNYEIVTERVSADGNYIVLVYDHIGVTPEYDFGRIATALDLSIEETKSLLDDKNIPAIAIPCAGYSFAKFIQEFLSENGYPAKALSYNVDLSDIALYDEEVIAVKCDEILACLQGIDERLNHDGIVNLATTFAERYKITGDVVKMRIYHSVLSRLGANIEENIIYKMICKPNKAAA